jgi:hypothetical protein
MGGFGIWQRDEIQDVLSGLALATLDAGRSDEYLRGFGAALSAMAVSFGIAYTRILPAVLGARIVRENPALRWEDVQ